MKSNLFYAVAISLILSSPLYALDLQPSQAQSTESSYVAFEVAEDPLNAIAGNDLGERCLCATLCIIISCAFLGLGKIAYDAVA